MESSKEIVVHDAQPQGMVRASDFMPVFDITQAIARQKAMSEFIGKILTPDVDYGVMPGTNKTQVLLKPGAEKLCTFFGLSPMFTPEEIIEDWSGEAHSGEPLFYYRYKCQLWRGERLLSEAVGSCNSREKKYRFRSGERKCPECGAAAIIKGKSEFERDERFKGGFFCFAKKGGCGAKFTKDDPAMIKQEVGQVKNPDVYDVVNTCQKMAQKRALVAAVLIGTNASDSFTQDIEEELEHGASGHAPQDPAATTTPQAAGNSSHRPAAAAGPSPATSPSAGPQRLPEEPVEIPEELKMVVENLSKPGGLAQAKELMHAELFGAMPLLEAQLVWDGLVTRYNMRNGGAKSLSNIRKFVLAVHAEAVKARPIDLTADEFEPEVAHAR